MDTNLYMKIFIFLTASFISINVWAKQGSTLCDIFNFPNCSGVTKVSRRSSQQSLPSAATSASLNPANVSFDKGFGIEAIHQSHNKSIFNLATGTEKIGGVLINSNLENSFFGNRTPEAELDYLERRVEKKQYSANKYSSAIASRILKRKNSSLDFGVLLKYNTDIKRLNPGIGISSKLGFINLGASVYQDDFFIDSENYEEKLFATTYSIGSRVGPLAFDFGGIRSKYKYFDEQVNDIYFYSIAYTYQNALLNLAIRNEKGPFSKYVNGELRDQPTKTDLFGSIQISLGKNIILALNYNYFLLSEISISTGIFF
jgi:hypothetical protein